MCYDWLCGIAGGGKEYPPELAFKKKGRGCTDLLGLALYIASWIAIIVIISTAGGKGGNPNKIIHGVDYEGRICGKDGGVMDKPYVAWPFIPSITDANEPNIDDFINVRVCLKDCADTETNGAYMMRKYKSRDFIYYCIPDSATLTNITAGDLSKDLDNASNRSEREIASLLTVWPALLGAAGIALVLTFIYNFLTKYIAGVIVWLALLLLTLGGFLTSYVLLKTAGDVNSDSPTIANRAKLMRGFGWTVAALTLIAIVLFIALRKRMYIAIETIKEASRAVDDMKSLTIWPFFPLVFALGYITFFIATSMFIISVTTTKEMPLPSFMYQKNTNRVLCDQADCIWNNPQIFKGNYSDLSWDTSMKHSFVYAFFHLLWSTQFIIYFNYIVIAGAIASWYFSYRDDNGNKIRGDDEGQLSNTPVCGAVWRVIRYTLGTVAIAALIIAIIKFIRACVLFIEKKLHAKGEPNRLQKCLFCMIHCCLKCIECCCDKINKNLLVWNAIYGHNFASSACSSFALVWANLGRIAALHLVGEFIMFVGKLVVALLTTGFAGLIIFAQYRTSIESPTLALAICFIIGYVVSSMFMLIFEVAIDAVFLCFLIDEKLNASHGKMFASPGLKEIVEKHSEESKLAAQDQNTQVTQRKSLYNKGGMAEAGASYN